MSRLYTLNCGQYVIAEDGKPAGPLLDEVALAIDADEGHLLKHGKPDMVVAWAERMRSQLSAAGMQDWSEGILCITGRFPLDELNRCLECSTYAGVLLEKVRAKVLAPQPLVGNVPAVISAARARRP